MQFDSRSPHRATLPYAPTQRTLPLCRPASWFSAMFVNEITVPSIMVIWNLIWRRRIGCNGTTTRASKRWRNVFFSHT